MTNSAMLDQLALRLRRIQPREARPAPKIAIEAGSGQPQFRGSSCQREQLPGRIPQEQPKMIAAAPSRNFQSPSAQPQSKSTRPKFACKKPSGARLCLCRARV